MKSILEPDFKYRPSHDTDITVNWDKARKQIEKDKQEREELRKKIEQIPHIGRRS